MNRRCVYELLWDFDDHKGWQAILGQHDEGEITWIGPTHELVVDDCFPVGFDFRGFYPNEHVSGNGYATFDEAVAAFELALFSEVPA